MNNMNYQDLALSDIEAGQRRKERYEYYLVALVFTTLAFSIQTATNTGIALVSVTEVCSWLSLFASGMFALSRMYHLPVVYAYSAEINSLSENIEDALALEREGHTELKTNKGISAPIKEYIAEHRDAIDSRNTKTHNLNKKLKRFSISHRVLFVLGFLLLMCARAYPQFKGLL